MAFHPLTHILSQISVVSSQACVPALSAQDCMRVMQRTRDAGCPTRLWGSRWQVITTLDSFSLSSGRKQLFGVFLRCARVPGGLAGGTMVSVVHPPLVRAQCLLVLWPYQSVVLQAGWELHLPASLN